jgi:hypothetical protein
MLLATSSSRSTRALADLLLEALPHQLRGGRPHAPLLGDLVPLYAVDEDGHVAHLPTGWSGAQELLPIVGGPTRDAACHLVARCHLLFDEDADVGESGDVAGDLPLVALAVGFLEQRVADEAGAIISSIASRSASARA